MSNIKKEKLIMNKLMQETAQKAYNLMKKIPRDDKGNPLTLENTIRAIILKNPLLVQYREDALEILYCRLGAGIEWINGRLGDNLKNNYINMPPEAGGQGCWSRNFGMDDSIKQIFGENKEFKDKFIKEQKLRQKNTNTIIINTINNIDERCQQFNREKAKRWYPISWYSCNLCAPYDAQEDFKNGAIETIHWILNTEYPFGTQLWVEQQRTKQYAQEILDALIMANKK